MGKDVGGVLPSRQDFDRLVAEANDGDPAALEQLRRILDECPQIWQSIGDLAAHARLVLVRLIAGDNKLFFESLLKKAKNMEEELAGPSPSPLERLAVQRVVAMWLECQYVDTLHPLPQADSLRWAKFQVELKQAAQRRFDAAVKSLTLVRKLLPATVVAAAKAQVPQQPSPPSKASRGAKQHVATDLVPASKNGKAAPCEPLPARKASCRAKQHTATDLIPASANGKAAAPINRLAQHLNPAPKRTSSHNRLQPAADPFDCFLR